MEYYKHLIEKFSWGPQAYRQVNFISLIAATCGWLPLEKGEEMMLHDMGEDGETYLVKRIK